MPLKIVKQIEKYINSPSILILLLHYLWYAFLGTELKIIRTMDLKMIVEKAMVYR